MDNAQQQAEEIRAKYAMGCDLITLVAAALGAKDVEIERLTIERDEAQQWIDSEPDWKARYMANYTALEKEIALLRSQLAVAQGMRDKAEWADYHASPFHGSSCDNTCDDERHDWTDEQWIKRAERP